MLNHKLNFTLLFGLLTCMSPLFAQQTYDELIQQALQQRNSGEFQSAEASLRQARELARESNEVDNLLGMTLAFQERFIEALDVIEAALERYPDDRSLQLARARVLSYQGMYDQAIASVSSVLGNDSNNIEAQLLRARIYYYQSRYSQAAADFEDVLNSNPENLDALIGLYDVELARNNDEEAERLLTRARAVAPDHIDVTTREQRLIAPRQRPHTLSLIGSASDFDVDAIDHWYGRAVDYRYTTSSGDQILLYGEHAHRFSRHDSLLELGYRWQRAGSLPVEIALAHTPDDDFLPSRRLRISTLFNVFTGSERLGATTLDVSYRHASYQTGNVQGINLGFSHYLLGINAWLTPGVGLVRDEKDNRDLSWTLGAHWQSSPRLRLGYNFTHAPETENSITVLTRSHHLYASYGLTDNLALRIDIASSDREASYRRDNLALSLQLRF
jgi:YaiO family outer membrane protein